ncbi:hypothetical protein B0H16DRAFT_1473699 [Mycena metata]|uniref:Uncharacterized protein n=1 Tax=Mycena metata TaxID=1033252 RepID=A0AAD7HJN7_9AGAR|nr:hypothetical protein B0H16DRAFT_1473699 [Mycena metata]
MASTRTIRDLFPQEAEFDTTGGSHIKIELLGDGTKRLLNEQRAKVLKNLKVADGRLGQTRVTSPLSSWFSPPFPLALEIFACAPPMTWSPTAWAYPKTLLRALPPLLSSYHASGFSRTHGPWEVPRLEGRLGPQLLLRDAFCRWNQAIVRGENHPKLIIFCLDHQSVSASAFKGRYATFLSHIAPLANGFTVYLGQLAHLMHATVDVSSGKNLLP